jgi:hypothetical protein
MWKEKNKAFAEVLSSQKIGSANPQIAKNIGFANLQVRNLGNLFAGRPPLGILLFVLIFCHALGSGADF